MGSQEDGLTNSDYALTAENKSSQGFAFQHFLLYIKAAPDPHQASAAYIQGSVGVQ